MQSIDHLPARARREAPRSTRGLRVGFTRRARGSVSRALVVAATGLLAAACGGGDDSIDDQTGSPSTSNPAGGNPSGEGETPGTCAMWVALSGSLNRQYNGDDLVGCRGNGYPSSPNLDVIYGIDGGSVVDLADRVRLRIDGVQKGDSGSGFGAQAIVTGPGTAVWQTSARGCSVSVTASERYGKDDSGELYQVTGSGSCSEAASGTTANASGSVNIGAFDFSAPVRYAF